MQTIEWTTPLALGEVFYCIIGVIFLLTGLKALRDGGMKNRVFTAAFWFILAFTFIAGPYLPYWITGVCVIAIAALTAFNKVAQSKSDVPDAAATRKAADKFGYKVFIPALTLAVAAAIIATLWSKQLGANNAIGLSAIAALLVAFVLFRNKPAQAVADGTRLTDNVGPVSILPQVLAALGALFTAAGVGDVISKGVQVIIPDGSKFIACAVYCIAMALFTIIMGNGFAAFSVITVGIGIPFLVMNGANPIVVGALGLTAGYCGTLMTPMAANFNIMPAALLETRNKYAIIKSQVPMALFMLVVHIFLMYFFAF